MHGCRLLRCSGTTDALSPNQGTPADETGDGPISLLHHSSPPPAPTLDDVEDTVSEELSLEPPPPTVSPQLSHKTIASSWRTPTSQVGETVTNAVGVSKDAELLLNFVRQQESSRVSISSLPNLTPWLTHNLIRRRLLLNNFNQLSSSGARRVSFSEDAICSPPVDRSSFCSRTSSSSQSSASSLSGSLLSQASCVTDEERLKRFTRQPFGRRTCASDPSKPRLTAFKLPRVVRDDPVQLPASFQPSYYSVFIGRGKLCSNAIGNRRLRVIVQYHVKKYSNARSQEKTAIVSDIVDMIHDACPNGGAFIRFSHIDGTFWEVEDTVAREKVASFLRDCLATQYRSSTKHKVERRRQIRAAAKRKEDNENIKELAVAA